MHTLGSEGKIAAVEVPAVSVACWRERKERLRIGDASAAERGELELRGCEGARRIRSWRVI